MFLLNRINIQTPESVNLEFTLAGIGNRAYALIFDYLILGLIQLALVLLWGFLSWFLADILLNTVATSSRAQQWLSAIWFLLLFAVYVGYFVWFEVFWQGQTPGKRRVQIRVIRDDGRPCGLQQSTLRALLRPVDDLLFIGAFLIALSSREKRVGDWVAGTLVIQEDRAIAEANFTLSESAKLLKNQLLERANLSALLPDDFAIIREYLQRRTQITIEARSQIGRQLATQVKRAIILEPLHKKVSAEEFLEAVYLAYQEQRSRP
ncbi:RDD family protein [Oscillatoria acuminata]|uniref:Putative membrane protein/domain protein n=1 Tax=Oscillatoria acuminata PCC 6304 TaxID=56110 RepID=K9TL89_9CYAN|nr:RDD family protein [Oscillatoria acuminata]AFY83637.1 putative membrane protein/domain protein [Oscillatoria acuminata PCC 6304]